MTVRSIASVEFNRPGKLLIEDGRNRCTGRDAMSAIGKSTWRHEARGSGIRNNILCRSRPQCGACFYIYKSRDTDKSASYSFDFDGFALLVGLTYMSASQFVSWNILSIGQLSRSVGTGKYWIGLLS